MVLLLALAALASAPPPASEAPAATSIAVSASARAVVRILPGARVTLGAAQQPDGKHAVAATITLEDGRRQPAKLVEFQ